MTQRWIPPVVQILARWRRPTQSREPPATDGGQREERSVSPESLLALLSAFSAAALRAQARDPLLEDACRVVVEAGGFDLAWVGLRSPGSRKVEIAASAGPAVAYLQRGLGIDLGDPERNQGPTGQAMLLGQTVVCHDTQTDPLFVPWREIARTAHLGSSAAFPLRRRAQLVGALNVYAGRPASFPPLVRAALESLADLLGLALDRLDDAKGRGEAQQELSENEERFRLVFENAPVGVVLVSLDGQVMRANRTACHILRQAPAELESMTLSAITHPEDVTATMELVQALLSGASRGRVAERRYVSATGETIWALASAHLLRSSDGTPAHFVLHLLDITERKHAEDALRASNTRLQAILDASPAAIFSLDSEGRVTSWNPGAELTFGWSSKEAIGKPLPIVPPDKQGEFVGLRERVLLRGESFSGVEVTRMRRDGMPIDVSLSTAPLRRADGRVEGILAVALDVTERKAAERAIRQINADLEERVRLRTRALEATNKELEAFAYSVSHDLRAPLRAVDGFARALQDDHAPHLAEDAQHLVRMIRESAQRMAQLIEDLLAFSRLGRRPVRRVHIDMGALFRSVVEELADDACGAEIRIGALPAAQGDGPMIRQVAVNLVANALKFTHPKPERRIEIGGRLEAHEIAYFVGDNGVGFDMRYSQKLFGVFQRLHSAREFPGSGVGLALVQRIVHRHGGRVWAEGEVGVGATFHFTLPLEEPPA